MNLPDLPHLNLLAEAIVKEAKKQEIDIPNMYLIKKEYDSCLPTTMIQFHGHVVSMFGNDEDFKSNEKLQLLSQSTAWVDFVGYLQQKVTRSQSAQEQNEYAEPIRQLLVEKLREQGYN